MTINDLEKEQGPEAGIEQSFEQRAESETNLITGAEMLESPPDGSFIHGLQVFIAWVKTLVADDK